MPANIASAVHRNEYVNTNKIWYCEGDDDLPAGRWKVRSIGPDNNYVCVRLTGGGLQNVESFDIGYVMRQVREENENTRSM